MARVPTCRAPKSTPRSHMPSSQASRCIPVPGPRAARTWGVPEERSQPRRIPMRTWKPVRTAERKRLGQHLEGRCDATCYSFWILVRCSCLITRISAVRLTCVRCPPHCSSKSMSYNTCLQFDHDMIGRGEADESEAVYSDP